jgi:hypothetical protein
MSVDSYIDLLGKGARDRVTGFAGRVTSVSFDLYGCVQAALTPPIDKDGKRVDGIWLDVHRLDVSDDPRCMPVPAFATSSVAKFGATPAQHAHGPDDTNRTVCDQAFDERKTA